jgi:lipopolysaccharide export system permease protein
MLFQKSLLRELRSAFGGVFAVLITTLVTVVLIRTLGRAAAGRVDTDLVFPIIVFSTLNLTSAALMLAIYVSIILVLSRWWRDSEAVVWLSAGKSLFDFFWPLSRFVWPLLILVAGMSTVVAPWAQQKIIAFEDELRVRGDARRISPGQFRESYSGSTVFFVENPDSASGRIGSVFIRSIQPGGLVSLVASSTGKIEIDSESQSWVILERGYRTDFKLGNLESRVIQFDEYKLRSESRIPSISSDFPVKAVPTLELIGRSDPVANGEKVMRFGLPLLTLGLGFLALPMSISATRSTKSINLILALIVYLLCTNLLTSFALIVNRGYLSFDLAIWPLPFALILIAFFLTWRKVR